MNMTHTEFVINDIITGYMSFVTGVYIARKLNDFSGLKICLLYFFVYLLFLAVRLLAAYLR